MAHEPFTQLIGHLAALPAANIDTDVIMPKVFLKGIDRSGLANGLFHDLRFKPDGSKRLDFMLNKAPWNAAKFLVTGANFGCGSSREHAVWGLKQFGIRAVLAESFAGIFFDNCARNGLLAVTLNRDEIDRLKSIAQNGEQITIDLPAQRIYASGVVLSFDIDDRRKKMLVNGLDAIAMTLEMGDAIEKFQAGYLEHHPWTDTKANGQIA